VTTEAPPVLVIGFDARPTEATADLFSMVRMLLAEGAAPQVLLIGDGGRLPELRGLVPVTVVNDFRWRGPGAITTLVRADRVTQWLKSRHLRRWLRRRTDRPWIIQHPTASAPLRHASRLPATVVARLPEDLAHADLVPLDRDSLAEATHWVVADAAQAEELAHASGEVLVLEGYDIGRSYSGQGDPTTWPILLVPTPGAWDSVNHSDEVARHLADAHPDIPVVWLASPGEDHWLADHDLRASGLADTVVIATRDEVDDRLLRAVVRTGYGPAHHDLVAHAQAAFVPVVELCGPGEVPTADRVPPFAVHQLLDRLDRVLTDPDVLTTVRRQLKEHEARRARIRAARARLVGVLVSPTSPA